MIFKFPFLVKNLQVSPETTIVVGNFCLQKLVSDDLKWSEMPKKHDFQISIFGEKFTSLTRNDDRGGNFFLQKLT